MRHKPKQPPPMPANQLHAAAVRELSRPIPGAPGAGVILTLLMAVPTFGVLPTLLWPISWRGFVTAERQQLLCLARWVRINSRHPRAKSLITLAAATRTRPILSAITSLCSLAVVALFFLAFSGNHRAVQHLLDSTYRFLPAASEDPFIAWRYAADLQRLVFSWWVGLLSVATFAHWLQVQLHARSVRKFLDLFNTIAVDEGFAPVALRPIGIGLRPLWIAGAVLMILNSAPWAIPLVLAGAVQRRYTHHSAQDYRTHLAERAREMLLYRRPPALPLLAVARVRCRTNGCAMPLPAGARFCPRCGNRSAPRLDRVA